MNMPNVITVIHNHGQLVLQNPVLLDDGNVVEGTIAGGGEHARLYSAQVYTEYTVGERARWLIWQRPVRFATNGDAYIDATFCG